MYLFTLINPTGREKGQGTGVPTALMDGHLGIRVASVELGRGGGGEGKIKRTDCVLL